MDVYLWSTVYRILTLDPQLHVPLSLPTQAGIKNPYKVVS